MIGKIINYAAGVEDTTGKVKKNTGEAFRYQPEVDAWNKIYKSSDARELVLDVCRGKREAVRD